ncbi:MAG TPA: DnaJ domain-containing protein [Chloroflexota bacterium]|nr:DnaJ domain-containing protein [Chloroflexota bacterium]
MVDQRALYAVLGLSPGADQAAIRQSYRALARRLHPDVNRSAGAAGQMRELNAAYDALRNLPAPAPATAQVRATAPASAAPFSGFAFRTAGTGAAAVSAGSPLFVSVNGVTIGLVAGFIGLVTLLAVWAFAVTKPFAGATAVASQSRPAAPTTPAVAHSTTSTAAAQASANAAANAAAARSNLTSASRAEVAGVNSANPAPPLPTTAPSQLAQTSPAAPVTAVEVVTTQPADSPLTPAVAQVPETTVSAQTQSQTRATQPQPSIPAVPATQPSAGTHISAVANPAPAGTDPSIAQSATRALSAYDKSWTAYATALRVTAAGTLASNAISSAPAPSGAARLAAMSPSSLLSGEAQLTMARTAHFKQQLAWNTQAGAALTASANSSAPRPDLAKSARADQRLRQAADLVSQSSNAGAPLNTTQLKTLLDEAEQLHRESVAEWARLLASLS